MVVLLVLIKVLLVIFSGCSAEILPGCFVLVLSSFVQVLFVGFAAHSSRLCLVLR